MLAGCGDGDSVPVLAIVLVVTLVPAFLICVAALIAFGVALWVWVRNRYRVTSRGAINFDEPSSIERDI